MHPVDGISIAIEYDAAVLLPGSLCNKARGIE